MTLGGIESRLQQLTREAATSIVRRWPSARCHSLIPECSHV